MVSFIPSYDVGSLFLPLVDPMLAEPSVPTAHGSIHGLTPAAPFSGTPFITFSIHSITPPLISTPITTVPRPPSLHLEDPWVMIRLFSEVLACLQSHRTNQRWVVFLLMR